MIRFSFGSSQNKCFEPKKMLLAGAPNRGQIIRATRKLSKISASQDLSSITLIEGGSIFLVRTKKEPYHLGIHFGCLLDPFWGPFRDPWWGRFGAKTTVKQSVFAICGLPFGGRFGTPLGPFWGSFRSPFGSPDCRSSRPSNQKKMLSNQKKWSAPGPSFGPWPRSNP